MLCLYTIGGYWQLFDLVFWWYSLLQLCYSRAPLKHPWKEQKYSSWPGKCIGQVLYFCTRQLLDATFDQRKAFIEHVQQGTLLLCAQGIKNPELLNFWKRLDGSDNPSNLLAWQEEQVLYINHETEYSRNSKNSTELHLCGHPVGSSRFL